MNVKLLREIKKWILAEPKRLYMPTTVATASDDDESQLAILSDDCTVLGHRPFPKCGTAACFAGWACILSSKPVSTHTAAELLGLDSEQAGNLFYGPDDLKSRFGKIWLGSGTKEEAKLAAARIEHFIKTKGAE